LANRLDGKGVVVTRPRELAAGLAGLIERAGGRPWLFPAIEIVPPRDPVPDLAARIARCDAAIFISRTAVRKALEQVAAWPAGVAAFAIGEGTQSALVRAGIPAQAPAGSADTEALLQLPGLRRVSGKRIVIVCGEGGRQVLGEALRAGGAAVERAAVYRRTLPADDPSALLGAWAAGRIQAVTVSSAEGVANLFTLLGDAGAARLRETPLFVPHARVAEAASSRGVRETVVAGGAADAEMLARLVAYFDIHG
jgi:uroporphyrinogen-III synthase